MNKHALLNSAADTYNRAADSFDAPPLGFWSRHGAGAVELAALQPGARVLDVGCGTGSSALPASVAVGPGGRVVGVDIAASMLARARLKAAAAGLENLDFRCADMLDADKFGVFDSVLSVFSLFFVEDMAGLLQRLWRAVKPRGNLVVTVWAANAFQPCADILADELAAVTGVRDQLKRPWERVSEPAALHALIVRAGLPAPEVVVQQDTQPLQQSADWWTVVQGSGFRAATDDLQDRQQAALRSRVLRRIDQAGIRSIETSALHAVVR